MVAVYPEVFLATAEIGQRLERPLQRSDCDGEDGWLGVWTTAAAVYPGGLLLSHRRRRRPCARPTGLRYSRVEGKMS